jgi:hypothetical protein
VSVLVELRLAGVWTDITSFCQLPISITRGRQDEASAPQTATCTVRVNNSDGRFSPKYTSGAYYPNLTLGTQMRVTVDGHIRFVGALYEYPEPLAPGTEDSRFLVSLVANGPRRRLARNNVLRSPYRRAMDTITTTGVVDYWPLEDGANSTWFANEFAGGSVGTFTGSDTRLAVDNTWAGTAALPQPGNNGDWVFPVRPYIAGAETAVRMLLSTTNPGAAGHTLVCQVSTVNGGNHLLEYSLDPNAGTWKVRLINQASKVIEATVGPVAGFPIGQQRVMMAAKQSGPDIAVSVTVLPVGATSAITTGSLTFPGATLGNFSRVELFNGTGATTTYGHVAVETAASFDIFDIDDSLVGWAGESAYTRAGRLSTEEGITLERPVVTTSTLIGPQGELTYLELLDECADVDYGLSTETVDAFGLTWRGRQSMFGTVDLTLARTDLLGLSATYDDQAIVNDVTITRPLGSSAHVTSSSSTVGTAAVGVFATAQELNLFQDTDLADAANARLNAGTVDEIRVPQVTFDAWNSSVNATNLAAMREGDTIKLTGWGGKEGIANPVTYWLAGWTEVIDYNTWIFTLNLAPSPLARAFTLDDTVLGVLDVDRLGY